MTGFCSFLSPVPSASAAVKTPTRRRCPQQAHKKTSGLQGKPKPTVSQSEDDDDDDFKPDERESIFFTFDYLFCLLVFVCFLFVVLLIGSFVPLLVFLCS